LEFAGKGWLKPLFSNGGRLGWPQLEFQGS